MNPGEDDLEAAGRQELVSQATEPGTDINAVMQIQPPSKAEQDEFQSEHASYTVPSDLNASWVLESSGDNTPNITQSAVALWVMGEIAQDAREHLSSLDGVDNCYITDANGLTYKAEACVGDMSDENYLANASIFGANQETCYQRRYGFNGCSVEATVKAKYECKDTGVQYSDYNSCSNACGDNICKKVTEYDDPRLELLGIDFINIADVSSSEKRLAVGRYLGTCRNVGRRKNESCKWGVCVTKGYYYDYCCYDSPMSMELAVVIKQQLGYNTNSCSGVPFKDFDRIDFDDPRIVAVMEQQTGKIIDSNMFNDARQKIMNQEYSQDKADELSAEISQELERQKIPGL